MNQSKKRVLVVGAGPSGLSFLRAMELIKHEWQGSLELVCVQKQSECGGQWNYFAKQKLDQYGNPIPSTNEYLWTNAPKQCFQYPDYSFHKHFNGKAMPSYLSRNFLRDYFLRRFSLVPVTQYIRFCTVAHNIRFDETSQKFITELENLSNKFKQLQSFDFVIVASGHYSVPNIPKVQGLQKFQGKLLHSIKVADYCEYKNDRVLVIGTGLSAEDAVLQCYRFGAKSITVTYRTKPMSQNLPESIQQLPILTKVQDKTVTFSNGQKRQFDTIIMCTGYMHNFVFLEEKLQLRNCGRLWSNDLYMGVVYVNNPRLMYIGTQAQYFSFMMFQIQGHFVKNVVLGKNQLPSVDDMKKDNFDRSKKQSEIKTPFDTIDFMGHYMKDLIQSAHYDQQYHIEDVIQLYKQLQRHKQKNVLTFRDHVYRSAVTGQMSVMKETTWLNAGTSFQNGQQDDPEMQDIAEQMKEKNLRPQMVESLQAFIAIV